jgi:hypothetical protein
VAALPERFNIVYLAAVRRTTAGDGFVFTDLDRREREPPHGLIEPMRVGLAHHPRS